MKLLIIGLGNIGTAYGWALSEAGVDVTHRVRPGRAGDHAHGIVIDLLDRREGHPDTQVVTYQPKVVEDVSPADGFDLVMAPTKHTQIAASVREMNERLPEARFLVFCAGWYAPQVIDEILPRARYAWGYASSTGGPAADRLVFNMAAVFRFGPIEGSYPPWADDVVDMFARAGVTPDAKHDMVEWLWVHHAMVAAQVGSACWLGGLKESVTAPNALRDFEIPATREALQVVEARGVDLSPYAEARPYFDLSLDEAVAALAWPTDSPWLQRTLDSGHYKSSMGEMQRFYFDVLETGEDLGVEMPVLSSFREKVAAAG